MVNTVMVRATPVSLVAGVPCKFRGECYDLSAVAILRKGGTNEDGRGKDVRDTDARAVGED